MNLRKVLKRIWFAAMLLCIVGVACVAISPLRFRGLLIHVRQSLFTSYCDIDLFERNPGELIAAGFHTYSPALAESFNVALRREIPEFRDIDLRTLQGTVDDQCRQLVKFFSHNGGAPLPWNATLMDRLRLLASGEAVGECSDHCEVFIALASTAGLFAREIHLKRHSVCEIYDHARQRWVFVDPEFALLARDESGEHLSVCDIRRRLYAGQRVTFEFFGGPDHIFSRVQPEQHEYYSSADAFSDVVLGFGNDVFQADEFRTRWRIVPKPIRQIVSLSTGVMPRYIALCDAATTLTSGWKRDAWLTRCAALIAVLSLAGFPMCVAIGRARRYSRHRHDDGRHTPTLAAR